MLCKIKKFNKIHSKSFPSFWKFIRGDEKDVFRIFGGACCQTKLAWAYVSKFQYWWKQNSVQKVKCPYLIILACGWFTWIFIYKSIFVDVLRVGTNMATWINEHGLDTVTALKTDWAGGQCSAGVVTVLVQMSTNVGPSLAALA